MPSIFVWRASIPNVSKKYIRYYSGSNWVVEDSDYSSRSYKYLQQIVIPGSNGDSVITFLAKVMPQDWVGSELLEVHHVPYHFIHSDAYATLEHIGNWMRVTLRKEWPESDFKEEQLQREWITIQQWMEQSKNAPRTQVVEKEYRKKEYNRTARPNMKPREPPISIPSISVGISHTIDPIMVRQSFQEFYAKFGTQSIQSPLVHRDHIGHRSLRDPRPPRH